MASRIVVPAPDFLTQNLIDVGERIANNIPLTNNTLNLTVRALTINFSTNEFQVASLSALSKSLHATMILQGNNLRDMGAKYISECLKHNTMLTSIHIGVCNRTRQREANIYLSYV
jgi:hypothetical protein